MRRTRSRRSGILRAIATAVLAAAAGTTLPAGTHAASVDSVPKAAEPQSTPSAEPFPVQIDGTFSLVDHRGRSVSDRDFRGRYLLVFFGYANCPAICPVGLRHMTEALDVLRESGRNVQPILITVDPENDTPEALAERLPKIHPRLVGLTGTPDALKAARRSYKVEANPTGQSSNGTTLFSHGTFIYLMGPDGQLLSVLPPVMDPETMAPIIERYLIGGE